MIEFEGQRYLMDDVYTISEDRISELTIEKTIKETDQNGGFLFVLTSYSFNGETGVVITSAVERLDVANTPKNYFKNIHYTTEEFNQLNTLVQQLLYQAVKYNTSYLQRFDEHIIVDVLKYSEEAYEISLWIDLDRRHMFTKSKWIEAVKRHKKFTN